jgi:TIR domain
VIATAPPITYDVFLSHNRADAPAVERLACRLRAAGMKVWLDAWCVIAGERWQDRAAEGMAASRSCAVFLGPHDVGLWEKEELNLALFHAASNPKFRVFLVVLPGVVSPSCHKLSPFLNTRSWVDLRDEDDEGMLRSLGQAIAGGRAPSRGDVGSALAEAKPVRWRLRAAVNRWFGLFCTAVAIGGGLSVLHDEVFPAQADDCTAITCAAPATSALGVGPVRCCGSTTNPQPSSPTP